MTARGASPVARKAARKRPKLKLNKETLKDLAAPDKDIKGGALVDTGIRCNINGNATNGCES
jgi:hypothetical protein